MEMVSPSGTILSHGNRAEFALGDLSYTGFQVLNGDLTKYKFRLLARFILQMIGSHPWI